MSDCGEDGLAGVLRNAPLITQVRRHKVPVRLAERFGKRDDLADLAGPETAVAQLQIQDESIVTYHIPLVDGYANGLVGISDCADQACRVDIWKDVGRTICRTGLAIERIEKVAVSEVVEWGLVSVKTCTSAPTTAYKPRRRTNCVLSATKYGWQMVGKRRFVVDHDGVNLSGLDHGERVGYEVRRVV